MARHRPFDVAKDIENGDAQARLDLKEAQIAFNAGDFYRINFCVSFIIYASGFEYRKDFNAEMMETG